MTVLVTGGAGYIGSHTVTSLINAGYQVVIYDDLSTGFKESLHPKAKFVQGSVLDRSLLQKTIQENKISTVVHFAAKLIVPESFTHSALYYETNCGGVINLIQACAEQKVKRIVFSSSAAVYGNAMSTRPVKETDPTAPLSPYGASKLYSEKFLQDAEASYGIKTVILRYFNVAGASQDLTNGQRHRHATHLIKVAAEVAAGKRKSMEIFGDQYPTADGTCVRDYIHVEDLASIHTQAVKQFDSFQQTTILNCGYGKGSSVKEVIAAMKKVSQKDFTVQQAPARQGDPASLIADCSQLKSHLQWQPKLAFIEEICRSAFEWEKKS